MRIKFQHNQLKPDGLIKNIISSGLFILFIINLIDQISKHQNIIERSYLTIPFLALSILIVILDIKKGLSFLFFLIGAYTLMIPEGSSDYSAALYFIFLFQINPSLKRSLFISTITIIGIILRTYIYHFSIFQGFGILLAFAVTYGFYYFLIYLNQDKKPISKFKRLTKEENTIIQHIANGMTQKEAGFELGYDKFKTNYIVKEIRKKLDTDSYMKFCTKQV